MFPRISPKLSPEGDRINDQFQLLAADLKDLPEEERTYLVLAMIRQLSGLPL